MNKDFKLTEEEKETIAKDVKRAVTPVIHKNILAMKLGMGRPALDKRLCDGDFTFEQLQILKHLKIITVKKKSKNGTLGKTRRTSN